MLHILLTIIKIPFLLLAILLLLFLAVAVLVSFVPVRYRISVRKNDALCAEGNVAWLFHFVSVMFQYQDKKTDFRIKLAGWTVLGNKPKKKRRQKKLRKKGGRTEKLLEDDFPEQGEGFSEEEFPEKETPSEKEVSEQWEEFFEDELSKQGEGNAEDVFCQGSREETARRSGLFSKTVQIWQSVVHFFKKLTDAFRNINETIQTVKVRLDYYRRLWYDEHTQNAWRHLKKEAVYLLKHFCPEKIKGRIRFGMEDPAVTGWLLGLLCILQAFGGNNLIAEAEFNEKVFEGDFDLKGHVRICHFWKAALALIFDRHCRITFKRISKSLQGGD